MFLTFLFVRGLPKSAKIISEDDRTSVNIVSGLNILAFLSVALKTSLLLLIIIES